MNPLAYFNSVNIISPLSNSFCLFLLVHRRLLSISVPCPRDMVKFHHIPLICLIINPPQDADGEPDSDEEVDKHISPIYSWASLPLKLMLVFSRWTSPLRAVIVLLLSHSSHQILFDCFHFLMKTLCNSPFQYVFLSKIFFLFQEQY